MGQQFVIPSIFTAVDKLSAPVRAMSGSLKDFGKSAESSMARLDRKMRPIGKQAALMGAAIVAPLALAVNEAAKFETSLAAFRTIVSDLDDAQFSKFTEAIKSVGGETKKSFTDVAASFEKIAGLNAKFADTAEGISAVSKASIILSRASGADLGQSAENLVGIMNQFSLGAMEANRAINVLAAGQSVGAASINQTAEAFVNFGSVAAGSNISLEQSVALIQTLGKFSVFGAEAGTKLRGSVLRLQKSGVGYASGQFQINDALEEARKKFDHLGTSKKKDAYLNKLFGAENVATGRILLSNIEIYKEFTKGVTGTSEAAKAAAINQNTLAERLANAKAQLTNFAIKIGEKLIPALSKLMDKITPLIDRMSEWAKNNPKTLSTIVKIAVGIAAFAFAVSGLSFAIGIATKAMAVFNFVMALNPISLIIIAIAALIALIVAIIAKWDEWGASVTLFLGPLGLVISMVKTFADNWEMVKTAFTTEGIIGGMKAIGKVFMDAMLYPMQQLLEIIAQITGLDWARNAANKIKSFREQQGFGHEVIANGQTGYLGNGEGVISGKQNPFQTVNPKAQQQDAMMAAMSEHTNNANVRIDVNDKNNNVKASSDSPFVKINTSSTLGW